MGKRKSNKKSNKKIIVIIILVICALLYSYYKEDINSYILKSTYANSYNIENIPKYQGEDYVILNNNEPEFSKEDLNTTSFEKYSDLDSLGRCGVAYANISKELMPTEERSSIGMVKPSGWHTIKYDIVDGKYLYNRCHLIGYQLTGENANEKNLITCTRHMNANIMLEFENKVASYIKETNNHVLYRVTPLFEGDNLLATGVQLEALSVEDYGKGIKFNVFIYNVQDGINIDYKNGESSLAS
ncbi:MAG: DNA/RNA non-specific endonuclease [Bacilli bacterium]